MSCISQIAGNIGFDCQNPIVEGYTGRGVLIPANLDGLTITKDSQNPLKIKSITWSEGGKAVRVDNEGFTTPFDGSQTTGSNDAGFVKYVKTISVTMPERGADFAHKVLDPLVKSGVGFIGIFEKKSNNADGKYEVIGVDDALRVVDPSTVTRSESANGGAWTATLQASEVFPEYDLDYESLEEAKKAFEEIFENKTF